jgi:hypothetical protein
MREERKILFCCGTKSITRHITRPERHITPNPLPSLQEPAKAGDRKIDSNTARIPRNADSSSELIH